MRQFITFTGVITETINVNADEPYSFRMERTTYKTQDLIYEEPGHKLVANVEMSGVWRYDWVGSDTEFQRWTEPAGEPIPETKREQILERLAEWGRREKVRIDIGPPVDLEAWNAELQRKGWTVTKRPDGVTVLTPPPYPFWRLAVWVTLFGCIVGLGDVCGSSGHPFVSTVAYIVGFLCEIVMLMRVNGPGKVNLRGFFAVVWFFALWLLVVNLVRSQ